MASTTIVMDFSICQSADCKTLTFNDHTPTSASTQATVAAALAKSLIQNSEKYVNIPFTVGRVNSDAGTEALGAADTLVAVRGSKSVTVTESGGVLPYLFVVGDYIRFGVTDADPVYKITATTVTVADGGTLTLDIAAQENFSASGTGTCQYITAAQAAAADFGIKLTGRTRRFQEGVWRYEVNKWITTVAGMGATLVANVTVPSEGTGTYSQIAEDEWFYQGNEGMHQNAYLQVPPVTMRKNAVAAGTYDTIDIIWSEVSGGTDILQNPIAHKAIKVVVDNRTTAYSASALKTAIDANC